jgi:hypothetical protein
MNRVTKPWISIVWLLLALMAALAAGVADAADWRVEPRVEAGAIYNDNYEMATLDGSELEVYGPLVDAQLTFRRASPVDDLRLMPRIRATYYPDEKEHDYTDYYLTAAWLHRGERIRSDFRANYAHETVFQSELPGTEIEGDLGDPDDGDTGRVTVRQNRDFFTVREGLTYRLSERTTIEGGAEYRTADYDEESTSNDFSYVGGRVGVGWALSPTSTIELLVAASRYEPDEQEKVSTSYGAGLEWRRTVSEAQRMYIRAGARNTDTERSGQPSTSETGFSGGVGTRWSFEVTDVFVDLTATLDPSGSGNLVERDQLRLSVNRKFTPRLSLNAGARLFREVALGNEPGVDDRDYAAGSFGMEWRLSQRIALKASYELQWQEYHNEPSDARANSVLVSMIYEPDRVQ